MNTGYKMRRRGFLTVGAVGGLGLTLGDFFHMRKAQAEQKHYDFIEAKAKSVIHIYLPGGMSAQETFDPKPYAPIEYRGEMGNVKTNTGEVFSETVPQLAKMADKIAVIRSMTHSEAAFWFPTRMAFPRPAKPVCFLCVITYRFSLSFCSLVVAMAGTAVSARSKPATITSLI